MYHDQQTHMLAGEQARRARTKAPDAARCAESSESSAPLMPSGSPSRPCARAHTCSAQMLFSAWPASWFGSITKAGRLYD